LPKPNQCVKTLLTAPLINVLFQSETLHISVHWCAWTLKHGDRNMRNQIPGNARNDIEGVSPLHIGPESSPPADRVRVTDAKSHAPPPSKRDAGDQSKGYDFREVAKKLKQDYAHGARDASIRQLDTVHSLIKYLMKADPNLDEMLEQTARLVYTQFNIKEVSIGLKSVSDGLYTYDDLYDAKNYKPITISHQTKLYMAEDNPYAPNETGTYNEHMMKQSKRKSATDSIEGDYLDIFIFGPQDETLGWIEISGTWDGRIPDAKAIRCLEMVSSVLGIAITRHQMAAEIAKSGAILEPPKKAEQTKK
jgi:hypothetical protein